MRTLLRRCARTLLVLLTVTSVPVQPQQSGQGTLLIRIEPECAITSSATTEAARSGDGSRRAATTFRYKLRTSKYGGGSIELRVDRPGATFDYVTRLSGQEFAGSQVVPLSASMTMARFGPDAHSSRDADAGTIVWSLRDASKAPLPRVELSIRCY